MDDLENLFAYRTPTDGQLDSYGAIRIQGLRLARVIEVMCPPGPDATAAIRKVREAVMTANASIATGGGFYK